MHLPARPALPITTSRLVLREFRDGDLEALLDIQSDAASVRYVPYPPRDRATVAAVLQAKISHTALSDVDDRLDLAATLAEDGTLIGDLLLALRSVEHETLEVGYIFSPAHGGRGYAREAVRALLELAFGDLGARRVIARVDARNAPSLALLDRIGMRREAYLVENEWFKGELGDEIDYALLSREWNARGDRAQ